VKLRIVRQATRVPVRIGNAGPKGKGLFARTPIQPSVRVATFAGAPRWIWDIPERDWPYTFQVDYDRYVLPRRNSGAWYINHSCEPNCVVSGRAVIAERRIGAGEELTFDYSTDIDWPGFRMACRCGSSSCRKVIRAYRFLPKRLKLRYGRNVADFIFREYGPAQSSPPRRRGQRK
jgi:hypothetical protein